MPGRAKLSASTTGGAGTKSIENFTFGEDTLNFRIDGNYFAGCGLQYGHPSANIGRVPSAEDFLKLFSAVLSDDGANNRVSLNGNDITIVIDADNHFRGDLTINFVELADDLFGAFGLRGGTFDQLLFGTGGNDLMHCGGGAASDGDDIISGGAGGDTFFFDSRGLNNNRNAQNVDVSPTDVVFDLNFGEGDKVAFVEWGAGFFSSPDFSSRGGRDLYIDTAAEFDAFYDFLNVDGSALSRAEVVAGTNDVLMVLANAAGTQTQTVIFNDAASLIV